jgi:hypothetical protein
LAALFLWHQTAFITVSSVGLLAGRVPGLLTAPTGGLWVAERLAWLPVFAIMLSGLWLAGEVVAIVGLPSLRLP